MDDRDGGNYTYVKTLAAASTGMFTSDTACDTFGIRTLALDAARGLRVNGISVKRGSGPNATWTTPWIFPLMGEGSNRQP